MATAAYGAAGELTSLTMAGRDADVQHAGAVDADRGGGIDVQYVYSADAEQRADHAVGGRDISGEQVTYQYDQLNRLMKAETADSRWGKRTPTTDSGT